MEGGMIPDRLFMPRGRDTKLVNWPNVWGMLPSKLLLPK